MPQEPVSIDPPFRLAQPFIRQSWLQLTFLHWHFPPSAVRSLVPPELELDLWEGRAYVGLVPFLLDDITLTNAPAAPWISRFLETNVRTYVRDAAGRRGVWFFSLDAARLAAVIGARIGYALPYYWARMSLAEADGQIHYRSKRRHGPAAMSDIVVRPGEPIAEPSPLEGFLTAQWRLYAYRQEPLMAQIEHPRWPLRRANVLRLDETLLRAAGLPQPAGEPLAHFAPAIHVLTQRIRSLQM